MTLNLPQHCRLLKAVCLAAGMLAVTAAHAQPRCIDEARAQDLTAAAAAELGEPSPTDPRATLRTLVRDALDRSQAVGASRFLVAAALSDIDETRAGQKAQASSAADFGPGTAGQAGPRAVAVPVRTNWTVGQLSPQGAHSQLVPQDAHSDRMGDWRSQLAQSLRLSSLTVREQLAMNTVALALERSRYRQHVRLYSQHVRQMACLVEALEIIVRADHGRATELVQAYKTLEQAQWLQSVAQSQARQIDARLRRLVGDGLPGVQGLATVLLTVEPMPEQVAEAEGPVDMAQINTQRPGVGSNSPTTTPGGKPQMSWSIVGGGPPPPVGINPDSPGNGRSANFSLGLAVCIPLYGPGDAPTSSAAGRRAEAARLEREQALQARHYRAVEVHERTLASFAHARRVGADLRQTGQLRNLTLQQWQQLGRNSLLGVMDAEAEHYQLRARYIDALHEGQQLNAMLLSLGHGATEWLR